MQDTQIQTAATSIIRHVLEFTALKLAEEQQKQQRALQILLTKVKV